MRGLKMPENYYNNEQQEKEYEKWLNEQPEDYKS